MAETAGTSSGISENNVPALEEAVTAHKQLLKNLYSELDVEREATATAASEALSMILRLQEERAAILMEATQYKRMAEAKMYYTEQTVKVLEELIYQKEMDIASLEFQVQLYRHKLTRLGWNNKGFNSIGESRCLESFSHRRCDSLYCGEMGLNLNEHDVGRRIPMPSIGLKEHHQKKRMFLSSESIPFSKVEEYNPSGDVQKKPGDSANEDLDSYWEQMRKLEERVKEISCRDKSIRSCIRMRGNSSTAFDEIKCQDNESSASVHGVPAEKSNCTLEEVTVRPREKDHCHDQRDEKEKMVVTLNLETELPKQRDINVSAKFQQILERIERLEKLERNIASPGIVGECEGELSSLNETKDQLNYIQKETTCWRSREHQLDQGSLATLMEAKLYFWL